MGHHLALKQQVLKRFPRFPQIRNESEIILLYANK
jgi:hypothetical protein